MSIVIETFIICDGGCGETFGVDNRSLPGKYHRENAKKEGWLHSGGKDYCPSCRGGIRMMTYLKTLNKKR